MPAEAAGAAGQAFDADAQTVDGDDDAARAYQAKIDHLRHEVEVAQASIDAIPAARQTINRAIASYEAKIESALARHAAATAALEAAVAAGPEGA